MRTPRLFTVEPDNVLTNHGDKLLAQTVGGSVSRHYTLNKDLAEWMRDEGIRRQWSPDVVVRYAVAKLREDCVWGGDGRKDHDQ